MRNDEFSTGGTRQSSLTERDHAVLSIAGRDQAPAWHANEIFEDLGMNQTQFAMHLNRLLDNPDANAQYPTTVNRWRRMREQRLSNRSAGLQSLQ